VKKQDELTRSYDRDSFKDGSVWGCIEWAANRAWKFAEKKECRAKKEKKA
jgi:hypothetical protein